MSHENKSNSHASLRGYQLQFSRAQQQALSQLLPPGYTLELLSKLKKESSNRPTKKIFTNEGNAVTKITPVQEQLPLVTTPSENVTTPSAKRILRDKKQSKSYFEDKFPEAVPVPTTSSKPVKSSVEATKRCSNLLQRLKKHNNAGPFLYPVDVEGLGLYDYYDVVKEPMDISTVEKKLKSGEYSSVHEFGGDIRKIWDNALAYNAEGSAIYIVSQKMKVYFEKIFKEIEDVQFNDKVKDLEEKVKNLTKALTELTRPAPATLSVSKSNSKSASKYSRSPAVFHEEAMSVQEKKVLCEHIKKLPPEALRGVWEIVSRGLPNNQSNKEELVFDIDILPVKITRELDKYVKNKIASSKPVKGKPKEHTPAKSHPKVESSSFNHGSTKSHGIKAQVNAHSAAPVINKPAPIIEPAKRDDDAESKSSDSSFISDSDSGSEDERKQKTKPAPNYHLKQQDLANFQAGSHGSMMNSFIVK